MLIGVKAEKCPQRWTLRNCLLATTGVGLFLGGVEVALVFALLVSRSGGTLRYEQCTPYRTLTHPLPLQGSSSSFSAD